MLPSRRCLYNLVEVQSVLLSSSYDENYWHLLILELITPLWFFLPWIIVRLAFVSADSQLSFLSVWHCSLPALHIESGLLLLPSTDLAIARSSTCRATQAKLKHKRWPSRCKILKGFCPPTAWRSVVTFRELLHWRYIVIIDRNCVSGFRLAKRRFVLSS